MHKQVGEKVLCFFPILQVIGQLGTTVGVLWEGWSSVAQQLGLAAAHEQHLPLGKEWESEVAPWKGCACYFFPCSCSSIVPMSLGSDHSESRAPCPVVSSQLCLHRTKNDVLKLCCA